MDSGEARSPPLVESSLDYDASGRAALEEATKRLRESDIGSIEKYRGRDG